MLLLAIVVFVAIILVALAIGGIGILVTGGFAVLFGALDFVVGGLVLLIPIHCIRKHKKKKKGGKE